MIDLDDLRIPTLYPEPKPGEDVEISPHMYTKKPKDDLAEPGWVKVTPAWKSIRSDYEGRGFQYMDRYGKFHTGATNQDRRGVPWTPEEEPWRLIFQMEGAAEFPVDQVIAFHWHLAPPYREVRFPQLDGVDIYDYQCPECRKPVLFSSRNEQLALRMLRQHLTAGFNSAHEYTPADLREYGQVLGVDFNRIRITSTRQEREDRLAPVIEPTDDSFNMEYACKEPGCTWAPLKTSKQPVNALRFHMKRHEKNETVVVDDDSEDD